VIALIELQQKQAEDASRRWFYSPTLDLIAWFDEAGLLTGFELYYDKQADAHMLAWKAGSGFAHFAVDDGEQKPVGEHKQTPLLVPDGRVDAVRILQLFQSVCADLPADISQFVQERLAQFPRAHS